MATLTALDQEQRPETELGHTVQCICVDSQVHLPEADETMKPTHNRVPQKMVAIKYVMINCGGQGVHSSSIQCGKLMLRRFFGNRLHSTTRQWTRPMGFDHKPMSWTRRRTLYVMSMANHRPANTRKAIDLDHIRPGAMTRNWIRLCSPVYLHR